MKSTTQGNTTQKNTSQKHSSHVAREIIETIALTLFIFIVIHFTVQNYLVDGISMQPGLQNGEYVLVNKVAYLFHSPERGDVIVFEWPRDTTKNLIKRVIGLPGDTLVLTGKTVTVDGVTLKEPYISAPVNFIGETVHVPANEYFVMGDNRPASDDSRDWGLLPRDDIIGKAVMVYWPSNHWQLINTYSSVYAQIKPGS
ncbi:MAG TPA: signal peptidase I [Ktedonobacteraceae bacterium]|nr:signal peptidase I [Ktedonobacteraceae bacterium]